MNSEAGLVLGGGGGKGSYQIGVLKALRDLNVHKLVTGVSGASAGALNGALFSAGDFYMAEKAWESLREESILTANDINSPTCAIKQYGGEMICNGLFSNEGLLSMIEAYVDLDAVKKSKILFFAAASRVKYLSIYNYINTYSEKNLPHRLVSAVFIRQLSRITESVYFDTGEYKADGIKNILLASAAIPFVFPDITIENDIYIDGGITDNVPVLPLYARGYRKMIVVALGGDYEIPAQKFPGAKFLDLSMNEGGKLESLAGTFDFTARDAKKRIEHGYGLCVKRAKEIVDFFKA